MTGWIKFNRSMIDSPVWGSPFTLRLLLLLSCRALQKEFMYVEEVKVLRGQYLRSYSRLAEDLQYVESGNLKIPSKNMIRLSVERLRKYGLISTEETKIGTLFTLLQNENDFSVHENGRTEDEEQNDEPVMNAPLKEECKKGREKKEKESVRAREDLPSNPDVQMRVEKVTEKFLKLRNSGFYLSLKEQCAIEKIRISSWRRWCAGWRISSPPIESGMRTALSSRLPTTRRLCCGKSGVPGVLLSPQPLLPTW
ncbi:hypothetical protein [Rossellomorea vietnamensis]|uniref:hypothetical protein n=1 Tax=Rossellomorea vietnamensis TaxID=218284 RepID=UPI0020789937|nr:hypothetical protein [Rossellomorea vietnamensis]